MRLITWLVSGYLVLLCSVSGADAAAQGLDARTYELWERHWRLYAQRCAEFEGEYICSPAYDRRYPSSAGITVRQAEVELSEKVKVRAGGMVRTKTVKMPIGEARAMALPIPALTVGQYGYLSSVEVDGVRGPKSMQVADVYLIDPVSLRNDYKADRAKARQADDPSAAADVLEYMYSRRVALSERQKLKAHKNTVFRLEGFSTRGLTEQQRWEGPRGEGIQILIFGQEVYGSERRPRRRLVAVAVDQIKWGLDEDTFIKLLAARGLDPAGFVARVMEEMAETDPQTAQQEVFLSLLPSGALPAKEAIAEDVSSEASQGATQ